MKQGEFAVQKNLKSGAAALILVLVAACKPTVAKSIPKSEPEKILLSCDAETSKPVKLTLEDGSVSEETVSYRGFYRIDLQAETLEAKNPVNAKFLSQCSSGSRCKLVSNKSEIRFEDFGHHFEDKIINVTYVFERNTGYFYRIEEIKGSSGTNITYANGNCKPMNSIDDQLF